MSNENYETECWYLKILTERIEQILRCSILFSSEYVSNSDDVDNISETLS